MSDYLQNLLSISGITLPPGISELITNPINIIFAALMFFLFFRYKKKDTSFQELPPILVAIGILGTFTGIFISLLNFNVDDIEKSIPQLLSGLKTAFFTSVLGLILSTWIKARFAIKKMKKGKESISPETPQEYLSNISSELNKINKSLTGDEDLTILTQIQKARMSIDEKFDQQLKLHKSTDSELRNISGYLSQNDSQSKEYSKNLSQIIDLLSELKEESRNLQVSITLAPELEERFTNLIKNSDELIEVVKGNVDKIDEMHESITDSYKDGILMVVDKMIGVVRNIDKRINVGKGINKENVVSISQNLESLSNNINKLLMIEETSSEGSYLNIIHRIDKIKVSTYAILDELRKKA